MPVGRSKRSTRTRRSGLRRLREHRKYSPFPTAAGVGGVVRGGRRVGRACGRRGAGVRERGVRGFQPGRSSLTTRGAARPAGRGRPRPDGALGARSMQPAAGRYARTRAPVVISRGARDGQCPFFLTSIPARYAVRNATAAQEVSRTCGRVTVPGFSSAARVAWSRYAFGSTAQSFADSMRIGARAVMILPADDRSREIPPMSDFARVCTTPGTPRVEPTSRCTIVK